MSGLVAGQIDWDVVDEELYHIPAEYKDQRFDSLKHVLTVLGAVDSEGALEEVRLLPQACATPLLFSQTQALAGSRVVLAPWRYLLPELRLRS